MAALPHGLQKHQCHVQGVMRINDIHNDIIFALLLVLFCRYDQQISSMDSFLKSAPRDVTSLQAAIDKEKRFLEDIARKPSHPMGRVWPVVQQALVMLDDVTTVAAAMTAADSHAK